MREESSGHSARPDQSQADRLFQLGRLSGHVAQCAPCKSPFWEVMRGSPENWLCFRVCTTFRSPILLCCAESSWILSTNHHMCVTQDSTLDPLFPVREDALCQFSLCQVT